jgi:hypothetical protein
VDQSGPESGVQQEHDALGQHAGPEQLWPAVEGRHPGDERGDPDMQEDQEIPGL